MIDLDDLICLFKTILMALFLFALLFVPTLFFANKYNDYSCKQTANLVGVNYKYSFATGCLFKTKKGYIPSENYKYFANYKDATE
jgi:hypothetical protein